MRQNIVLHIDDDPEIRTIVKLSLELRGDYSTISAGSTSEALQHLEQVGDQSPACIMLDYYVGGTFGIDFIAALRNERKAAIPIVFLTTRLTKGFIDHMLAAGALGVIGKPFNPVTLAQELRALLGDERH